ncbi:MAG TPA: phosphoribosylamine--glycine ligase [Gemmatimonadales bacterium]|nr:phosphoribosylamine--glycine ligase [Gemmatimonadales bacterium]
MRVLVVGSGGREHALCWALAPTARMYCAPGNPGTATVGTNLPIAVTDHAGLLAAVREHDVDLTVIGPEGPLAAGLADAFRAAGRAVFGPSAAAARIEASKAYAKDLMARAGVPTAASRTFTTVAAARAYIDGHPEPLVVKASGLAAGKGAIVCATRREAREAATAMFEGRFGDAGAEVVVEAFLEGEELSVLALTDGERTLILPPSQDHKRLGEGDTGPNTGGMGAYAPVSLATSGLVTRIEREILGPTLRALAADGAPYAGVLYAGLMIAPDGAASVVEFNCRLGDPETQVVLPVAETDLLEHFWRIGAGERWSPASGVVPARGAAVTTILAARGYPGTPEKGAEITLPSEAPEHTILFQAGTARDADGTLRVAGGRVLCATGLGPTVAEAAVRSRRLAEAVRFEGEAWRRDIAWREVARAGAP